MELLMYNKFLPEREGRANLQIGNLNKLVNYSALRLLDRYILTIYWSNKFFFSFPFPTRFLLSFLQLLESAECLISFRFYLLLISLSLLGRREVRINIRGEFESKNVSASCYETVLLYKT